MRNLPALFSALGVVVAGPAWAAETGAPATPEARRNAECAIADAAIELKLSASAGMRLAYSGDLPSDKGVLEDTWAPRISREFLREFDARRQVSAIPLCPALKARLEALGARAVEGRALDEEQWRLSRDERTAVLRVTLPIFSADGAYALVRVEAPCGWGCGSGDTYQFARDGEVWKRDSMRMEWSGTVMFDGDGRQIPPGR